MKNNYNFGWIIPLGRNENKNEKPTIDLLDFEDFDSPTLPQEEEEEKPQLFTQDLQKELEAKFDELFGPIDDE